MAITTLVDYWTNEESIYTAATTAAQTALGAAQAAVDTARAGVASAGTSLAQTNAAIDALKRKLAADTSPADADADAKKLRVLIGQARNQAGVVLRANEDAFDAQVVLDAAKVTVASSVAKRAEATAAKLDASAKNDQLTLWKAALAAAPLATLAADAASALAATAAKTPRGDALARLNGDIPASLQTAGAARRAAQNTRFAHLAANVSDTEALLVAQLASHVHTPDVVDAARVGYTNAWNAFAAFVKKGKEDFDRAIALYGSVSSAPALTPDEIADINGGPSKAGGEAALAPPEDDRDKAQTAVYDDEYALEKATVATLAPDPTAALPVLPEQTKLVTDQATLAAKELAFSGGAHPTPKENLDAWEAALPDAAYRALVAFQEADEILTRLAAVAVPALTASLTAAEATLAGALVDATAAARTIAYLRTTLAQQATRRDHGLEVRQDRLFSYVRGDT